MRNIRFVCLFLSVLGFAIQMRGQNDSNWNCNIYAYQYDMTFYLNLKEGGVVYDDYSDYEIGAFKGDECRGASSLIQLSENEAGKRSLLHLRVRSNAVVGDTLMLRLYKKSSNTERVLNTGIVFKSTMLLGTPSNPVVIPLDNPSAIYLTNTCKVTFIADGDVVKEETLNYGSAITIPNAPDKEGYTFQSWGEVDTIVPPHDVTYTAVYTKNRVEGDVNEDGYVNISDVVAVINQIAGIASWLHADVNGDKLVNISDVVKIINIIAGI